MRIRPKELLFGYPILKIREVMRIARSSGPWVTKEELTNVIAHILSCSNSTASKLVGGMLKEEYFRFDKSTKAALDRNAILVTDKGQRLAATKSTHPISRAKADLLLAELLQRVKAVNLNEDYAYKVATVKVFGSYLSSLQTLGDLDVAIELAARFGRSEMDGCIERRMQKAFENGRVFRNISDQVCWPRDEVLKQLRTRRKGLSLHVDDTVMERTDFRIVFQA